MASLYKNKGIWYVSVSFDNLIGGHERH